MTEMTPQEVIDAGDQAADCAAAAAPAIPPA